MISRSVRLQELFQHEISALVSTLKDPGIAGFLTVTGVELSADVRTAKVFFSVLGSPLDRESTTRALERSAGHLRAELKRKVSIKYIPKLVFVFDETPERAHRIESLISQLHSETQPASFSDESLRQAGSTPRPKRPQRRR